MGRVRRFQPRARLTRGQAVIELSLLLIVMIPIIFYTLFLDDLLRHRLDLLESVVSSPWDFVAIDQQDSNGAAIGRLEALSWCDHTIAYNSYEKGYECSNDIHHKAFTAHVCWVVKDGQQVSCSTDKDSPKIDDEAKYNGGGITTCSARAGVFNYFIVQSLLGGKFSQVKLTPKETMTGSAHSHYGAVSANIYMLEGQKFGVLHDTWTVNHEPGDTKLKNLDPGGLGGLIGGMIGGAVGGLGGLLGGGGAASFEDRVKVYYDKYGKDSNAFDDAKDFFKKLDDEKLIKDSADDDGISGDDVKTLHLSFDEAPGHDFGGHTSSAWSDSRVQGTYNARKNSYFGRSEDDW